MMRRNRNIMLMVLMILFTGISSASILYPPGSREDCPIILPSGPEFFMAHHTADAMEWGEDDGFGTEVGRDIFYQVELPERMNLIVHTFGSELLCTRVQIIGPGFATIFRARDDDDYRNYCDSVGMFADRFVETTQDCFVAFDLPAGVYEIRTAGYRKYNNNPVNGPITVNVIGFGDDAPAYPNIPESYIPGTITHPFPLGRVSADFKIEVNDSISKRFFDVRKLDETYLYYGFDLTAESNITIVNNLAFLDDGILNAPILFGSQGDSKIHMVPPDTLRVNNCQPGRYLLKAYAEDCIPDSVKRVFNFTVTGEAPPVYIPQKYPPYEKDLTLLDPGSVGKNFISTRTMLDESGENYIERIDYYDGLGRQSQTVAVGASPQGGNIVTAISYDRAGRVAHKWLPAVTESASAAYTDPSTLDFNSVYGNDTHPFTTTLYEASPMNRPISEAGPGQRWASAEKTVETEYCLNNNDNSLRCLYLTASMTSPAVVTGNAGDMRHHSPGTLAVTRTISEDGNISLVFTDHQGLTVLTRQLTGSSMADTYYVYDKAGNLRVVIPPEASTRLTGAVNLVEGASEILDNYCYVYTYDSLRQMTSKKLPGAEKIRYIYDRSGQVIASQDGNMRTTDRLRFTLTDVFGRECITGTCSAAGFNGGEYVARVERISPVSASDELGRFGYRLQNITMQNVRVLSATYYDDYTFINSCVDDPAGELQFKAEGNVSAPYPKSKGRMTGRITAVPVSAASDSLTYLASAFYHDYRNRLIQSVAQNRLGGYERETSVYDFAGRVTESQLSHSTAASDSVIVMQWQRDYDNMGRELAVRHRLGDGQWYTLSQKSYDAVGRLSTESFGESETGIERSYGYDIRSNPTTITGYGYSQSLNYSYGGLVTQMTWQAYGPHETQRTYTYEYDDLCRLTSAVYDDEADGEGNFNTAYSYDLNGNITTLSRMGVYDSSGYGTTYGLIDDLTYEYNGNQVTRITDRCTGPFYQGAYHFRDGADEPVEYLYDANGNMISDLNRGIPFMRYDHNNLPREIHFFSGARTAYIYSADGVKLQTVHSVPAVAPSVNLGDLPAPDAIRSVTDYCGPFVYEDGKLSRINLENGYLNFLDPAGRPMAQHEHVFYLRDHLGNNRVSVRGEGGGVLQVDNYYPFGLPMGCGYNMAFQRWRFGGKEMDRTAGLDLCDFEARLYDPATGRFTNPDLLAEKNHPHTPFAFCANNPLIFIDPTGMKVVLYATKLPGCDIPMPTHTFIAVKKDDGSVRARFSYGPENDGYNPLFGLGGSLVEYPTTHDEKISEGRSKDRIKAEIIVSPPEGMTQEQFDQKVIDVANSFGNNPDIDYSLNPTNIYEGNCNSSSSTILLKSGVSKEDVEKLKKQLPGISWGFSSTEKPWTAEEQQKAVEIKLTDKEFKEQLIRNHQSLTR